MHHITGHTHNKLIFFFNIIDQERIPRGETSGVHVATDDTDDTNAGNGII